MLHTRLNDFPFSSNTWCRTTPVVLDLRELWEQEIRCQKDLRQSKGHRILVCETMVKDYPSERNFFYNISYQTLYYQVRPCHKCSEYSLCRLKSHSRGHVARSHCHKSVGDWKHSLPTTGSGSERGIGTISEVAICCPLSSRSPFL